MKDRAILLCAATLVLLSLCVQAECDLPGGEWVRWHRVIDGDTLRLESGRKVRLLGVNAPELARDNHPAEPLAERARRGALQFLIGVKRVRLVYDRQRRDRYGRELAHIYRADGASLEAYLLRAGLAYQLVIPPNLALAECLRAVENEARTAGRGLWHTASLSAVDATRRDIGFRRLRGRVVSIAERAGLWLELEGAVVLRVGEGDRQIFAEFDWRGLRGRQIEVQGWLIDRSARVRRADYKPLMMRVRSPYALRLLR